MGAQSENELSKIGSIHLMIWDLAIWRFESRQITKSQITKSQIVSGTGGHRTYIVRFKRPEHYLVCHSPALIGAVGVEPTACVL